MEDCLCHPLFEREVQCLRNLCGHLPTDVFRVQGKESPAGQIPGGMLALQCLRPGLQAVGIKLRLPLPAMMLHVEQPAGENNPEKCSDCLVGEKLRKTFEDTNGGVTPMIEIDKEVRLKRTCWL